MKLSEISREYYGPVNVTLWVDMYLNYSVTEDFMLTQITFGILKING